MKVIGISGSLRRKSYNAALLRAAAELAPDGLEIEVASIRGIPLYDSDVEQAEGIPVQVAALKDCIAAADGLLLATPEYNNSIPGVFKNAIDWLSRPASDVARVFGAKPVGLIGASPGRMGTLSSQTAWLQVFRFLGVEPFLGKVLYVSAVHTQFDDEMKMTDEAGRERVRDYLQAFATFVDRHRAR